MQHAQLPVGQREFAVETPLDMPSLAAGAAHLADVTMPYGFTAEIHFDEIDTPLRAILLSKPNLVAHCR